MSRLLEKYQISIWMYGYSQIQGTRSKRDGELQDKSVPYFQQESGPCPLDWRITIHWKVDLVFFQWSWHIKLCWKIARTKFKCMVFLQSRGQHFILVKIYWSQDLRVKRLQMLLIPSKLRIPKTPLDVSKWGPLWVRWLLVGACSAAHSNLGTESQSHLSPWHSSGQYSSYTTLRMTVIINITFSGKDISINFLSISTSFRFMFSYF